MVGLWAHGWWCTDWENKAWQITYRPLRLPPRNDTHVYAHIPLARASHVSTPTFREAGEPNPSMFPGWQPKSASGHSTCFLPPQTFEHTCPSAWNTFSSFFGVILVYPSALSSNFGKPSLTGSNTMLHPPTPLSLDACYPFPRGTVCPMGREMCQPPPP